MSTGYDSGYQGITPGFSTLVQTTTDNILYHARRLGPKDRHARYILNHPDIPQRMLEGIEATQPGTARLIHDLVFEVSVTTAVARMQRWVRENPDTINEIFDRAIAEQFPETKH